MHNKEKQHTHLAYLMYVCAYLQWHKCSYIFVGPDHVQVAFQLKVNCRLKVNFSMNFCGVSSADADKPKFHPTIRSQLTKLTCNMIRFVVQNMYVHTLVPLNFECSRLSLNEIGPINQTNTTLGARPQSPNVEKVCRYV